MDTRRFSMEIDTLQRNSQNAALSILNGIKLYQQALLSEFIALTGYHRKHGIRLLKPACDTEAQAVQEGLVRSRRV